MGNCRDIEPQLTAYADGEVDTDQRSRLEMHLERCPRCRTRVATERATHDVLVARRSDLRGFAPDALRHRCAAQRAIAAGRASLLGRRVLVPLSLAATLAVAAALFVAFGWGSSVDTYAAQLADDHVKCFRVVPQGGTLNPTSLGAQWEVRNGWHLKVAPNSAAENLELVDVRRCGSSRGYVAHVLYRWHGQPLSVYVLNGSVADVADATHDAHAQKTLAAEQEQAVMWRKGGRTYAVLTRGEAADVQRVADYIRTAVE